MSEPNPSSFTFDDLRPSFSVPSSTYAGEAQGNLDDIKSHNPFENAQKDFEQYIKKRHLNDNSYQTVPATTSPKHTSLGRDLSLSIHTNFPVIQEIDESQTPTYTKETPSNKATPSEFGSCMNSLKRRLITDIPELSSSVVIHQAKNELKSIEDKYEALFKKFNVESPYLERKEEVSFPKPEGKLSKVQAKILSKETRYTSNKKPSIEKDEYLKLRRTLNEHLKYEEDSDTPFKRKVTMPPARGGSQSVSKFHMQQTYHHLSGAKKPGSKSKASNEPENFQFKARPMPRYVPFEAKKSDRPCVIPQEFHLRTEERGAIKHTRNDSKDSLEREFMNEAGKFRVSRSVSKADFLGQNHFKALPLPDFSRPFKPKVGTSPLTEIEEIKLNTELRAGKRTEFDSYIREREHNKEMFRHQQEEERKRKEQEEIAELRKNMVFRARPYKSPSPAIKDGNRGFPVPASPKTIVNKKF